MISFTDTFNLQQKQMKLFFMFLKIHINELADFKYNAYKCILFQKKISHERRVWTKTRVYFRQQQQTIKKIIVFDHKIGRCILFPLKK
jgi:hypothetical protein